MTWYLVSAIAVAGLITLGFRALPFAVLKALKRSKFVKKLGEWMPAGIILVLAVIVLRGEIMSLGMTRWWIAAAATAVTVCVHLFLGRRTLLSVAAGTTCYVLLVNFF